MEYNPENPVFSRELHQAYEFYFKTEPSFMAIEGYVNSNSAKFRKKALKMIAKHSRPAKFDAFIPFLAMNYFDRFVSMQDIPLVGDDLRTYLELCILSCLTLAWKMRKKSFTVTKFLIDQDINIDRRFIIKMELFILHKLDWRLRAVTPFCFVEFFIPFFKQSDQQTSDAFNRRNIYKIIIQTQGDIKFTKFKPSVIAASAFLFASSVLYPERVPTFRNNILSAIASSTYIKEGELNECFEAVDKLCKEKNIVKEHPVAPSSKAGEGESSKPLVAAAVGGEAPVSSSHDKGKKPMEEEVPLARKSKALTIREGKPPMRDVKKNIPRKVRIEEPVMNIPLKWVNPDDEEDEEPIPSTFWRREVLLCDEPISLARCGDVLCEVLGSGVGCCTVQ